MFQNRRSAADEVRSVMEDGNTVRAGGSQGGGGLIRAATTPLKAAANLFTGTVSHRRV